MTACRHSPKRLIIYTLQFRSKEQKWTKDQKSYIIMLQNPDFSSLFVTILLSLRTKVFQKPNVPMLSSVLVKLACGVEEGINGVEKVINTIVSHRL